jgi:hypothetical protein
MMRTVIELLLKNIKPFKCTHILKHYIIYNDNMVTLLHYFYIYIKAIKKYEEYLFFKLFIILHI